MSLPALKLEPRVRPRLMSVDLPIKILFITQAIGGVQKHLVSLARNLDQRIFDISLVCSTDGTLDDEFRKLSLDVKPIPMYRNITVKDVNSLAKLYMIMKKNKFDIIHTHSSKAGFLGRLCANYTSNAIVVHTPHAFHFTGQENKVKRRFYLYLERIASRWCNKIIAVSESERKIGYENMIGDNGKIISIPNAIDIHRFKVDINVHKKRIELGLNPDYPLITMVARICPQKDPITFVKMAEKVLKQYPRTEFIMVGGAPLKEYSLETQVQELIKAKHLENNVRLFGWRSDIPEILAASNIAVLTSIYEGGPYTPIESMAAGLPVVATNSVGTSDVVIHGKTGFLAPVKDYLGLARYVSMLLQNPDIAQKMGNEGRIIVTEKYSMDKMISKIENLYLDLYISKKRYEDNSTRKNIKLLFSIRQPTSLTLNNTFKP